jgi:thermostable 8-oxoguanine DNA glycosylase
MDGLRNIRLVIPFLHLRDLARLCQTTKKVKLSHWIRVKQRQLLKLSDEALAELRRERRRKNDLNRFIGKVAERIHRLRFEFPQGRVVCLNNKLLKHAIRFLNAAEVLLNVNGIVYHERSCMLRHLIAGAIVDGKIRRLLTKAPRLVNIQTPRDEDKYIEFVNATGNLVGEIERLIADSEYYLSLFEAKLILNRKQLCRIYAHEANYDMSSTTISIEL